MLRGHGESLPLGLYPQTKSLQGGKDASKKYQYVFVVFNFAPLQWRPGRKLQNPITTRWMTFSGCKTQKCINT
jgi:hypothetical protein